MSDLVPLPSPPEDVPFPTEEWPRAELDPRVDRAALARLVDGAFPGGEAYQQTNAVLVAQRGAIVLERYGADLDEKSSHISWSMAKSWLHAIVGVLVRQGRLELAAPAAVPEWSDPSDPRHAITLDQLLKMRSGLDFVEDYVESGPRSVIEMLFGPGQDDTAGYAAASPIAHPPGEVFYYSSGTSNIVSRLAAQAAGVSGDAWTGFMRRELFEPIGARSATLRLDAAGTWIGSSFLFATARDFARLGLLYLRDGVWDGRRILPEGWVDYARRETGREEGGAAYGAHWWVVPGSLGIFQAQGYNGQRTTLVPALDLIVVRLGVTPVELAPNLDRLVKEIVDCFRPTRS